MSKTTRRPSEKELVAKAAESIVEEKEMEKVQLIPGEPLPEGFDAKGDDEVQLEIPAALTRMATTSRPGTA